MFADVFGSAKTFKMVQNGFPPDPKMARDPGITNNIGIYTNKKAVRISNGFFVLRAENET